MRGFKLISMLSVLIFGFSLLITNWIHTNSKITDDPTFKNQLIQIENDYKDKIKILVYGSSGLLAGISSEIIEKDTNIKSFNISSNGLGVHIENALESISSKSSSGDVILVGDRDYRSSIIKKSILKNIIDNIKMLPNLKAIFFLRTDKRTLQGDLEIYPQSLFTPIKNNPPPNYNEELIIQKMISHINIAKQFNVCPVLVMVPILVNPNEKENFELATKKIISLAETVGLSQNILRLTSIETNKNLFIDQFHMSKLGRDKWTRAVTSEMLDRNLCDIRSGIAPIL